MTDEERQKLVADLRQISPDLLWSRAAYACNDAADEIERLAEELQFQYACDKAQQREIERLATLAQSDTEPVAWKIERLQVALGKIASICRDYSIATDSSAQIKENAAVRTSSRDVSTGK